MSQADLSGLSDAEKDRLLSKVQSQILWTSMQMVHHANHVRPNADGTKVGGHQASSASIATILTSLYFEFMESEDKISVKPHASPIFHAIQYLIGNLDSNYLTELRAYRGLQAYPSRTKDPDDVDFSTGSVGFGPVAPNFASIGRSYLSTHGFSISPKGRYISIVGDAELDEGSIWESIAEPGMAQASNIVWVVDLNRQSLDRIIPGIRVGAWKNMFEANGWNVVEAKYGKLLKEAFDQPNGELLRIAIDQMSNQVYQRLLRVGSPMLRKWLPQYSDFPNEISSLIDQWDDNQLNRLFHNLGGHDFSTLREAFRLADSTLGPDVIFAYTLKGFMLPSIGDPQNHSVVLSEDQMEILRQTLGIEEGCTWISLNRDTPEGQLCFNVGNKLRKSETPVRRPPQHIPNDFGRTYSGNMSTQQIFGLVLTDMSRNLEGISERMVTVSPDVASSTNLGGWINRVGVWRLDEEEVLPDEAVLRALRWEESDMGQHIELGISENNLFMMLGQLGLSYEMENEMLFPIGTLYDPFIRRGLDAFVYSVYSGGKFIVVGTPSGLSLAPEGGAHQSMMTPSIGIEMPGVDSYEPCFGQELEWIMLSALEQIRQRGRCTYLRLTSKPVDQVIMALPTDDKELELMRKQVLNGAYCIRDHTDPVSLKPSKNVINIVASGAMVPEAIRASEILLEEGIYSVVINVTGPGPLYRNYRNLINASVLDSGQISKGVSDLFPSAIQGAPVVTVADAHPHALAWVGGALESRIFPLGVYDWGQSGSRFDLYKEYGTDTDSIVAAGMAVLEG